MIPREILKQVRRISQKSLDLLYLHVPDPANRLLCLLRKVLIHSLFCEILLKKSLC